MLSLLLFLSVVHGSSAWWWSHPEKWNGLKTTYGINPFSSWNFDDLPRTVTDAKEKDFKPLDSQCDSPGQSFRGFRTQYKDDPRVLLLFDKNGYIAGIQMRVPASDYTPSAIMKDSAYVLDGDFWTLTAYVVEPGIICDPGRTAQQFAEQGTGTGLYIQNGTTPDTVINVPRNETVMEKTPWGSKGKCWLWMGQHYWFNLREDMTEEEFFPYCLLYNNGRLDAFCFAMNTDEGGSKRFEHPTGYAASKCCIHAPDFFLDSKHKWKKQSTMHVFLTDSPKTGRC